MSTEKEFQEWLKRASSVYEPISTSVAFASIYSRTFHEDPMCALQLGYAVMLGKPIILIVPDDVKISAHLTRIASMIERVDRDKPGDMERATKAMGTFIKGINEKSEGQPS